MGHRDSLVGGQGQDYPIPSLVEGAAAGPRQEGGGRGHGSRRPRTRLG